MIHYHECKRCTHQWMSACFDHLGMNEEQLKYRHRQSVSWICHDCFDMLEAGEIEGLAIFNLYEYLDRKSEQMQNSGKIDGHYILAEKYSGMCHEYVAATYNEDGSEKTPSNFVWGQTAEQKQLRAISSEVQEIFLEIIKTQRTPKRIELDEFQKTAGFIFFGPQPRPEGFEGDPPGKTRTQVLFGLDPVSGDILAPSIITQNGVYGSDSQN